MAEEIVSNNYEDIRKKRLLDNQKRFEDLGIAKISKSLSELSKSEKKHQQRQVKPRLSIVSVSELRRSSRARNPVATYVDEVDIGLPTIRKRSKFNSTWATYIARPLDECKAASFEERSRAIKYAEKLQSNLQSECPSFVKSMVRSHVYSCFWLGLPTWFCEQHLPKSTSTVDIVLENEDGSEYEAVYISKRTGLSGGWRAFALDHKLDDGDALVFELVEPTRFKVYIVKASNYSGQGDDDDGIKVEEGDADTKQKSKRAKKSEENLDAKGSVKSQKTKEVKKNKKVKEETDEPKGSMKSQKPKREKEVKEESHEKNEERQKPTRYSTRTRSIK